MKALTVLPAKVPAGIPAPPEGLGEYALAAWCGFFHSPVSNTVEMDAHGPRLRHWARCLDQREKLWEIYAKHPLVKGSHQQVMSHPVWRQVRELNEEIAKAEEAFGMTPLAQLRLGVTFLHERTLAQNLKVPRRKPTLIVRPVLR